MTTDRIKTPISSTSIAYRNPTIISVSQKTTFTCFCTINKQCHYAREDWKKLLSNIPTNATRHFKPA